MGLYKVVLGFVDNLQVGTSLWKIHVWTNDSFYMWEDPWVCELTLDHRIEKYIFVMRAQCNMLFE
jgi:hypothetical protein